MDENSLLLNTVLQLNLALCVYPPEWLNFGGAFDIVTFPSTVLDNGKNTTDNL